VDCFSPYNLIELIETTNAFFFLKLEEYENEFEQDELVDM
jgi:hypothetical protein